MRKKHNITADHILVYTIGRAINQWMMQKGGEFVFDYCSGVDRCHDLNEVIFKCLPEARKIIEENKDKLFTQKTVENQK